MYKSIIAHDSLIFDVGFNKCEIKQIENLLSENFEFYHDQAGITQTKSKFIESVKNNICNLTYKPRRVLEIESVQIFPLKLDGTIYGAIQKGNHKFYATQKNQPEYLTTTAQFTHIWILENNQWKLSKGLSYDHKDVDKPINQSILFDNKIETERWLKKIGVPILGIGFIKNSKIAKVEVFGELETNKLAPKNTIFTIASLTKPITAMIVMKLVNEGKWNLDEPIFKYWVDPEVANDQKLKKLTTRFILSHRSGFPNWRWETSGKKLSFQFEPGAKYSYSGEGFEYLRKALENKFKMSFDQLANEILFNPLKMRDTKFFYDNSIDETRFAKRRNKIGNILNENKNSVINAAYGVCTTVEDYTKFLLYVMNGAGLKNKLYNEMISNQSQIKQNQYFGLGWIIDEIDKENVITHGGVDEGTQTIAFILPKSKKGLIIFTNSGNGSETYIAVIKKYLQEQGDEIINVETK